MTLLTNRCGLKVAAAVSLSIASLSSAQSAQAASIAESSGGFAFNNFSSTPLFTDSDTDTITLTTGNGSEAIATADAIFEIFPAAEAVNVLENSAFSAEPISSAFAQSEATIIGDFFVNAGDIFSFDFAGFLNLSTATETPADFAEASLITQYSIFSQNSNETLTELDFFGLFGQLSTPTGEDDFEIDSSEAITLNPFEVTGIVGPTETAENIAVSVSGSYERLFEAATTLTLIELKQASAFSQNDGSTQVPEHSSPLVWLLGVGGAILLLGGHRQATQPAHAYASAPQFSYR